MNIIEMAREAGIHVYPEFENAFERFAELVRADEREACAKLCDEVGKESLSQWPYRFSNMIRARGEA